MLSRSPAMERYNLDLYPALLTILNGHDSQTPVEASDPRDQIYSLIGLLRQSTGTTSKIAIDYSLTCAEVYASTTR